MGKIDQKQTKKRSRMATCKSKHNKATDGDSKHKKQPSSSFDATKFEATNDDSHRRSRWRDQFRQLCDFKVQFGHCLVPQLYATNPKLGIWVSTQRWRYRNKTEEESTSVTAERIRGLNGIGFDWGTSKTDRASIWSERYQELREFKELFGHCNVPQHYPANAKLGNWISKQRFENRKNTEGRRSPMTAERIQALDGIGFDWRTSNTDLAFIWSVRFQELCDFKVQFGNCLVPNAYSASPKLGKWVSTQRKSYERRKPSM
jgi:hypothetical protein